MKLTTGCAGREQDITTLFTATFTASEGADEGDLVGRLAHSLLTETPPSEIRVFCAEQSDEIIGAGIFSHLTFPEDPRRVVLLSPMAVITDHQSQGIGQALLTWALASLRSEGFDVAVTYGDPGFYAKVGFEPITEAQARAPLALSLPHGWLGQSLNGQTMPMLQGPSICVDALNRADVW